MTVQSDPEALVSHLPGTDGSATFSYAGYTIVGAVNGPIEVQRRDELPEKAVVDVVLRPDAGVGGTKERHLESLLVSTLRHIILTENFPRTLIQITLQVTVAPENEYVNAKVAQAGSNLPMLPALIHTSTLALLSASIPMTTTLTAVILSISRDKGADTIVLSPMARQIEQARSIHVFAFTSGDDLILAESEGYFTIEQWEHAYQEALRYCCPDAKTTGDDVEMLDDDTRNVVDLRRFTRSIMEKKIASDLVWKA